MSPSHAGFGWSLAFGVVWLGIVFGGFILGLLVRAFLFSRRNAREEAERIDLAGRALSSGPHRVVRGKVELDGTDDVAIQIDIDQAVEDHTSKNSKWHTWEETMRETRKSPFYLVREDGEAVYVEPPDDVFIVDQIETKYPMQTPRMRVRFADVRRGEMFYAYGDLDRGTHARARNAYRDGSGWILRAPSRRMLLATEVIRDRYRQRIGYLRLVGIVSAVIFVILHMFITLPFLAAWSSGRRTTGSVIDRATWVTYGKNNAKTTHYSLTVRTPDNLVITREVTPSLFDATPPAMPGPEAPTIPVLEYPQSPAWSYFGFDPTLPIMWLMIGTPLSIVAMLLTRVGYSTSLPWYDRRKFNEHGGAGHWVEPRPRNPVKGV